MDIATIIGLAVTVGLIIMGIVIGSPLMIFFDLTSVVIVGVGSFTILFAAYPGSEVVTGLKAVANAC